MTVLQPDLAQQVRAAQAAQAATNAAARASAADSKGAAAAAGAEPAAEATTSSSSSPASGPWLLLVTRQGLAKRVSLYDIPSKESRGVQGVIGIKLNAGEPAGPCTAAASCDALKSVGRALLILPNSYRRGGRTKHC
jgi:hypothetical protein